MGYYVNGYVINGYSVGDKPPTIIDYNRVAIEVKILADTTDISDLVTSCEINKELGYAYHIFTITTQNYTPSQNTKFTIQIGSDSYEAYIVDFTRNAFDNYTITLKSKTHLLEFPKTAINETGNSHDILQKLLEGFDSYVGASAFEFNKGAFSIFGSKLDAIKKLISVSGADIYYKDEIINIVPHLRLKEYDTTPRLIINDDYITDVKIEDNDNKELVKRVIFNSDVADIYSIPKITMIQNRPCKKPTFLFNPTLKSTNDIKTNLSNMSFTTILDLFERTLDNERIVTVDGAILSISYIRLNGATVDTTEYQFEKDHNVIAFNNKISGTIQIYYATKAITDFSLSDKTYYRVKYLNQQIEEKIQPCSDSEKLPDNSGCILRKVSQDDNYSENIVIQSSGSDILILFVVDNTATPQSIPNAPAYLKQLGSFDTSVVEATTSTQKTVTIGADERIIDLSQEIGNGKFGFIVSNKVNARDFFVGARAIPFEHTTKNDRNIYYTTDSALKNRSVHFNYDITVTEYVIPALTTANTNVRQIEAISCGRSMIIDLATGDGEAQQNENSMGYGNEADGWATFKQIGGMYPPTGESKNSGCDDSCGENMSITCNLPMDIVVDVAGLLRVSVEACAGMTVSTAYGESFIIGSDGKFTYTAEEARRTVIDCSNIIEGAEIYIDTTHAEES